VSNAAGILSEKATELRQQIESFMKHLRSV